MSEKNIKNEYKKYICIVCGWIYDELKGYPEEGIQPKTKWKDISNSFKCPDCGMSKNDFQMIEI